MTSMVSSKTTEGDRDEDPIVLQDKAKDFVALVGYFFQSIIKFDGSRSQWLAVLRLAHKYEMEPVKCVSLESLTMCQLGALEMLQIADNFDARIEWAKPAFHYLCTRGRPLTVAESRLVNRDWAAAISLVVSMKNRGTEIMNTLKVVLGQHDPIRDEMVIGR